MRTSVGKPKVRTSALTLEKLMSGHALAGLFIGGAAGTLVGGLIAEIVT
ncbi:hypothetical protein ACFWPK_28690 [Nocardia sp. NPDC058519]